MMMPRWNDRPAAGWSLWIYLLTLLIALSAGKSFAADEVDEEEIEFVPGLLAEYRDAQGARVTRFDPDVQFVWRGAAPDDRLTAGPFHAAWKGRLWTMVPGPYRLHVFTDGNVKLRLNGLPLLDATAGAERWHACEPVELGYGYHPLEIEFATAEGAGRLGLYWSGPQFQLEPVPDRHLLHDPKTQLDAAHDEGRRLTRALRCAACHDLPGESAALNAPALDRLAGNLSPEWAVDWLRGVASGNATAPARRMPHFALSEDEARSVAAYLWSISESTPAVKKNAPKPEKEAAPKKGKGKARTKPSAEFGEKLANGVGCLACHRIGEHGAASLFGGNELTSIAAKRPADYFERWLEDPAALNASHRMPVFRLSPLERADLALYLQTLRPPDAGNKNPTTTMDASREEREQGRKLVAQLRCAVCHRMPGDPTKPPERLKLATASRWDTGCVGAPNAARQQPGYKLSAEQTAAVRSYVTATLARAGKQPQRAAGDWVLVERNCLACHQRGLGDGILPTVTELIRHDSSMAVRLPAYLPPSLNGVGDKLHDAALRAAISLDQPPRRTWLDVRMPRFTLAADELDALVEHFVDHDRIPDLSADASPAKNSTDLDSVATRLAAARLVTADGFGCTSCHKVGNSAPSGVALNALGTELTMLGERIRKPWFDRWVRNPARIIPRMEMPAIQLPVRGIMGDDVHTQLAAVWTMLNTPGFDPPPPNPVRVVRARNLPGVSEPAAIVTDIVEADGRNFVHPIVVGLPNRHNLLWDLETATVPAWWIGDAARERTRGKSWYWEMGGPNLLPRAGESRRAEFSLSGAKLQPFGQFAARLDSLAHVPAGVQISYRLTFVSDHADSATIELRVQETITALRADSVPGMNGWRRRVEVADVPAGRTLTFNAGGGAAWSPVNGLKPFTARINGPLGLLELRVRDSAGLTVLVGSTPLESASPASGAALCEVDYLTALPVDQFPTETPPLPPAPSVPINVVPGFEGVQLPLTREEMPTALAWRPDGVMVVASLKGRVLLGRDANQDGLVDQLTALSDDLAAPYGLAVPHSDDGGDDVDVIVKYGLVRLHDDDHDGRAERSEIIADGWGHTDDYHDWAVGLPRDRAGNYYVGLPCQQDDRDPAAARWRGQALRLTPRRPTPENPRRYEIENIGAGLRFPMGLALDDAERLYATDNQGNYNPFNELNHLAPGRHFGFINKLDADKQHPPLTAPAIDLPHPWTRSVNGICFLRTPPGKDNQPQPSKFGPFEGHLIGCEYNGKSLVRMTLEQVGDDMQGCVYPFSRAPEGTEPTFEGPVCAEISPDGDLYVGSMSDSGWGGGQNTGSIVRLRFTNKPTPGIAEVRAAPDGLIVRFTTPLDPQKAAKADAYHVSAYTRVSTPAYGGSDVDRHTVKVRRVELSDDARSVRLRLDSLKADYVYELRVDTIAPGKKPLFPAEAHYTMRRVPSDGQESAAN